MQLSSIEKEFCGGVLLLTCGCDPPLCEIFWKSASEPKSWIRSPDIHIIMDIENVFLKTTYKLQLSSIEKEFRGGVLLLSCGCDSPLSEIFWISASEPKSWIRPPDIHVIMEIENFLLKTSYKLQLSSIEK